MEEPRNTNARRTAVLVGLVLLIGGGLAAWFGRGDDGERAARSAAQPVTEQSPDGEARASAELAEAPRAERREEEPAAAAREPAADAPGSPEVGEAHVHGVVVDGFGTRVGPCVVELRAEGADPLRVEVADDGSFALDVPAGAYLAGVLASSLPPGILPPFEQWTDPAAYRGDGRVNGFYATAVDASEPDADVFVELRVFRAATVAGYVLDAARRPIEGAWVHLNPAAAGPVPPALARSGRSDAVGRFEITGVYPELYRAAVALRSAVDPRHHDAVAPLPRTLRIEEGDVRELQPFTLGGGDHVVRGTIVNQDGEPFAGLRVRCYLDLPLQPGERPHDQGSTIALVETDANGVFEFRELPAVPAIFLAPAEWEPGRPPGEQRAAMFTDARRLDLGAQPLEVELTPLQVDESRPYAVDVEIELDESWAREQQLSIDQLRVEVALLDPAAGVPELPRRISYVPASPKIDGEARAFRWACETPHPAVRITLSAGKRMDPVELVVEPREDRTESRTMRVPR